MERTRCDARCPYIEYGGWKLAASIAAILLGHVKALWWEVKRR
jgi:hypothetical protein